jgi:SAM-dependent methyltransferase
VTTVADTKGWGAKAASLYDGAYAARYRAHDDSLVESAAYLAFVAWLQQVCERCASPFDALDLGCGTGRYFCALRGVRALVGLDASSDMLAEARHPLHQDRIAVDSITLVQGDLIEQDFGAGRFDLVYSIGVLAEHVPLQPALVASVARWLRPGGRFAFSTVHPESASVPRTLARRLGSSVGALLPAPFGHALRERLLAGGLYADEARLRELLEGAFTIESLERMQSEAHLHCLCVARKADA